MRHPLREWAQRSEELLDDPGANEHDVVASLRDIARINRVFGGTSAAVARLAELVPPGTARVTLLDVGTGAGDIPRAFARSMARRSVPVLCLGLERIRAAARESAREGGVSAVVADGGALPFGDRSIDLVLCSKVLHHLPGASGQRLLRDMDRVARLGVVVSDIHRSAIAAAGLWLASFPMRFHPATRRDGVISIFRGFSSRELREVCAGAGIDARVKRHPGWCLTAAWRPAVRT